MTRRCLVLAALVAAATLVASLNVSAQAPITIGVIEPLSSFPADGACAMLPATTSRFEGGSR